MDNLILKYQIKSLERQLNKIQFELDQAVIKYFMIEERVELNGTHFMDRKISPK